MDIDVDHAKLKKSRSPTHIEQDCVDFDSGRALAEGRRHAG